MTAATDTNTRSARTLKYGTNVVLAVVLFLVVLGAINFLADKANLRMDLTRNKEYTVSQATRQILGKLKDRVTMTVYATEQNAPPDLTEQRKQLANLLQEYRLLSGGKVTYKFISPEDEKTRREAEQAGIPMVEMQQASMTEVSVKTGFFGMQVMYKGKSETIPVINPGTSLEYQLTGAINKVAQVNIPKIGFIAPGGNPYMGEQGNYTAIPRYLELEGYQVQNLEAAQLKDKDLKGLDMLMVVDPSELSEEALYRIDQYVMNGGKLFVAATGVEIDPRSMRASAKSPSINPLLESYGVRIDQNLLEDWGKGLTQSFMTMRGVVASKNPFMIEVSDLDPKSPITKKLSQLIMLFPSSISKSEQGTSATVEVLAKTSDQTKKQEQMFVLQQNRLQKPGPDEKLDAYNLAVAVKGPLKSRFAVVDPPALTEDNGTTRPVAASEVIRESKPGAEVIVVGSTLAFLNDVIGGRGQAQANVVFLLNVADTLTRGGEMIALRSKNTQNAVLRGKITPTEAATAQFLVIAMIPGLLVVFGLGKFYMNRMKRLRYREIYGQLG